MPGSNDIPMKKTTSSSNNHHIDNMDNEATKDKAHLQKQVTKCRIQRRNTFVNAIRTAFNEIDTNHDGMISSEELRDSLEKINIATSDSNNNNSDESGSENSKLQKRVTKHELNQLINRMDTNKDGYIDYNEFDDYVKNTIQKKEEINIENIFLSYKKEMMNTIQKMFNDIDVNNDGKISSQELRASIENSGTGISITSNQLRELMNKIDTNNDGYIDYNEFQNYVSQLPEVNPKAIFESFTNNIYYEDAFSEYSAPRDIGIGKTSTAAASVITTNEAFFNALTTKLYAGMIAGVVSRTATAPIERVKVALQTSTLPTTAASSTARSAARGTAKNIMTSTATVANINGVSSSSASLLLSSSNNMLLSPTTSHYSKNYIHYMYKNLVTNNLFKNSVMMQEISNIYKTGGGIKGFFRGNTINCMKVAPETSIKFIGFEYFKNKLTRDKYNPTNLERFICGALAGLTAQFTVYPLEVIKTRLMVAPQTTTITENNANTHNVANITTKKHGVVSVFRSIVNDSSSNNNKDIHPPKQQRLFFVVKRYLFLYKGLGPSLIGIIPYAGIDLSVNSLLKEKLGDHLAKQNIHQPSILLLLCCGMISSTVAMFTTYPLNLIRTKLQISGMPGKPTYSSAFDCIQRTYYSGYNYNNNAVAGVGRCSIVGAGGVAGGISAFYRGVVPNAIKVVPATSISYAVYDLLSKR